MRTIARLPTKEREALFANTAGKMGMTEAIIEKDFWVCWVLDYLFQRSEYRYALAFKGGTSLSKAYKVIERFSEDIDLVLDWQILGYSTSEPWKARSNTAQDRFNEEANSKTELFLRDKFIPSLKTAFTKELQSDIELQIDDTDRQTVLFSYPSAFSDRDVAKQIRLEIGALAAWTPTRITQITPYAAEQYKYLFRQTGTEVLSVLPERTFWEKITILHREANRPKDSTFPARYSRHYYDIYCLAMSPVKQKALDNLALLGKVIAFKEKFYRQPWAKYSDANAGVLKLIPPLYNIDALQNDYSHMRNMIFGTLPDFDILIDT
ncbi:MAG: nucleotidyl transferase AbiEii/AbiGii toxin family protein, partial [Oscillospiraceae bacterium]|nr:nucleotidyl transferase AbiEii/AbiGii toxin family protein [Oscillospiraceae bacterium]